MQGWTAFEEHVLRKYVESHFRADDSIDWSELDQYLSRGAPQCKTKYYRMLNEGKWRFTKYISSSKHKSRHDVQSSQCSPQMLEKIARLILEQSDQNVFSANQ